MGSEIASTLANSLLAEQRACWEAGERVLIEELLDSQPGLHENAEFVVDLIYAEMVLRHELGENPTADEYIARFPHLAEAIRTQFELDAAIDPDATQVADPHYFEHTIQSGPPTQVGRFKVVRELGRGGFGIVYLAYDPQLGRHVALKVPRADIVHSPELRQRFQQEARASAGLDHPNLVPVYEAGEIGSLCYIVSAYCPGINLADWIRGQKEPVPFVDAARLIRSLAEGVQHSHSKGILHRDLKPANVLLVPTDSSREAEDIHQTGIPLASQHGMLNACQPKITDFGLAKLSGADMQTKTGTTMGTPAYMAPEQAMAKRVAVGPATDVYSLGVMLYELLTGRTPFVADSPVEVLLAVQKHEPLPPSKLRQRLPRDLETICLKCLEKEPHRRYATASAVADDLGRYVNGDSILARPISPVGRAFRWSRRRPAIAALALLLLMTLATGISGVLWQWWRADRSATQAAIDRDKAQQAQKKEAEALDRHRIMRAHDEWQSDNSQAARDLLRDAVALKDTWEYRYVNRLCNLGLHIIDEHKSWVAGAAFTPKGDKLITAERDGIVLIRDLNSGESERYSILPASESISRFSISPGDGRYLAVTTTNGKAHVWDRREHQLTKSWDTHDTGGFAPVAYGPSGEVVATASGNSVRIWSVTDRQQQFQFDVPKRVTDMCWSPDEKYLAVCAHGMNEVRVWEVTTGHLTTIPTVMWMATAVAFSPDGKRFAWAGMDGVVSVYDAKNGFASLTTLAGSPGYQSCLTFSPDGRLVVSGARNGPARMWRVETGQLISIIHGHSSGVRDAYFSPDGSLLATVGADRRVIVSDVLDYQDVSSLIDFSPWQINAIAFASDGKRLFTGSNLFRLWDLDRRAAKFTVQRGIVASVAVHPNNEEFAGASEDGKVTIFDKAGTELASRQKRGFPLALKYVDEGKRLLIAGWDDALYSWNPSEHEDPQRILGPLGKAERRNYSRGEALATFSVEGDLLAHVERGQPPIVWDLKTRQKLAAIDGTPPAVSAITFDRAGTRLALGGSKGEIQIRDARSGELTKTLVGHPMEITGLAFTPEGSRLASVAGDGVVKLWDPVAGVEVLSLRGHATFDSVLAFSPDGEDLIVGGWDGFVRMWSIRDPQAESAATRLARRKAWHQWHAKNGYTTDRWFVVAHHLGQLMQLDPKSYRLPMERAWAFASMQEWSKAAADLELAMAKPECDADAFAQRAELFLYKGDLDSYRKACENLRDRFGSRNDLNTVNSLLWTSVLHPSVSMVARELASKAEAALANASPKDRRELVNTVGAVLYRAGRLDEAIKLFNESVNEHRRGGLVEDWVFLAMAHQKKGNKDRAREYLDRVTEELKKMRAGIRPSDGRGLDWRLLIELESLYAEANVICK